MPRRNTLQHCLHVFKFADRVNAINLIHSEYALGLSRSDSLYRPRFEVLSVKCFARVTLRGGGECADPTILNAALLEIARQLGHNRTAITCAYLGKSVVMRRKVARRPPAVDSDDPDST